MSKMKEFATVLDELVTCGETLISTANSLRDIFGGDADTPDSPAPAKAATAKAESTAPPSKNTKKQVQSGVTYEGWKVVEGKSNRKFTDEKKVAETVQKPYTLRFLTSLCFFFIPVCSFQSLFF